MRDGGSAESEMIGTFCGNAIPEPVTSTVNMLWMKFRSDGYINNGGFLADYEFIDGGAAGTVYNLMYFLLVLRILMLLSCQYAFKL